MFGHQLPYLPEAEGFTEVINTTNGWPHLPVGVCQRGPTQ